MLDYSRYTDKELLSWMKAGDEQAFSEIYLRYWDKLFIVSANRMGDIQEAEECVQDVLYKLWTLRETFAIENNNLGGYLAVAIRNQVFNRRLKRYRERLRAEGYSTAETDFSTPEQEFIATELKKRIDQAINTLPEQCRIVFELKQRSELTNKEIAEKLNISENTVKYHLKKANRDIRNNLEAIAFMVFLYHFLQK